MKLTEGSSEWGVLTHKVRSGHLWQPGVARCGQTVVRWVPFEHPRRECAKCFNP